MPLRKTKNRSTRRQRYIIFGLDDPWQISIQIEIPFDHNIIKCHNNDVPNENETERDKS